MFEARTIVRHAGTVLVGQLAVIAFGIADTIIAGRYDASALAALSVGSSIYISVYVALNGLLQALLPIWSELRGAGDPLALGRSVRQALYLCLGAIAMGTLALLLPHGQMKLVPLTATSLNTSSSQTQCDWFIVDPQAAQNLNKDIDMTQWQFQATVRRPSDNNEDIVLYKSTAKAADKL